MRHDGITLNETGTAQITDVVGELASKRTPSYVSERTAGSYTQLNSTPCLF